MLVEREPTLACTGAVNSRDPTTAEKRGEFEGAVDLDAVDRSDTDHTAEGGDTGRGGQRDPDLLAGWRGAGRPSPG